MKVLFIPGGLGYGHVSRCLALADELKGFGIKEIAFSFGGTDKNIIEQKGYKVYPVLDLSEEEILRKAGENPTGVQGPNAVFQLISDDEFISKSIEGEVNAIESFGADLVIYDGRWTGNIAAKFKKVPSVSIIQNYLLQQEDILPKVVPIKAAADNLLNLLNRFKNKINEYRKSYNVDLVEEIFEIFTSDINFAATIEGFGEISDKNEKIIKYWGPFLRRVEIDNTESEWMKELDPNRKTVYISTGGSRRAKSLLQIALDALKEIEGVQAVVSTGYSKIPYDTTTLPEWIILKPHVNGIAMTLKADVVVTHGGHTTIMELLNYGTPGLIIPFQPEQLFNGKMLENSNAGKVIPSEVVNKENFKAALVELLNNKKYVDGISKFKDIISGYPGASGAAVEILKRLSSEESYNEVAVVLES